MSPRLRVRVDPELAPLVPGYLARLQAQLPSLDEALAAGDFRRLGRAGHDLAGSGGSYGLPMISALGQRLHLAARTDDASTVAVVLAELSEALAALDVVAGTGTPSTPPPAAASDVLGALAVAARRLGEATSVESGARAALAEVAARLGWPAAALWWPRAGRESLRCVVFVAPAAPAYDELGRALGTREVVAGRGLVGRVFVDGRPERLAELSRDTESLTAATAVRLGLGGAVAWPVIARGEVLGVLEVYSVARPEVAVDVLETLTTQLALAAAREVAEAARAQAEERTRQVFDVVLDAVITIDAGGRVVDWSKHAEHLFGWSRPEAVGERLSALIIPHVHRAAHERGMRHHALTGEGPVLRQRLELMALHKSGREFPVELAISPVSDGARTLFTGFVRDISARRQAEEVLRQAKDAAEQGSRAKSEFLANMSHELRTPMNLVVGAADLLAEVELPEEARHHLDILRIASSDLVTLIDDVLDLAKVEAGHVQLEDVRFDLDVMLEQTIEPLALRAHEKGLRLAYHVDPLVPRVLSGDPTRLRQVLVNVLANAVKFTERGEVILEVEPGARGGLRCSVTDTGVGVPPDRLEHVFERFTQGHSSTTRDFGGTGLGLAICRSLVELMGGRIWAEPGRSVGACFRFELPVRVLAARADERQLPALRILVADPHALSRTAIVETLASWGAHPRVASTVDEARVTLREARAAGRPFDLVLLDTKLPGGRAWALVDELEPGEHAALMFGAGAQLADVLTTQDIMPGGARQLVQPVTPSRLWALLRRISPERWGVPIEPRVVSLSEAPARALRILLAEDNADNRTLVTAFLAHTPHHLDCVSTGRQAVEATDARTYDLVLMDM